MRRVKVGVVGCGNISEVYLPNMTGRYGGGLEVVALADLDRERAAAAAKLYGIPRVCGTEELLRDPDVEIVVNLTTPGAHTPVNLAALEAGKHVYCEKPLALTLEDARRTVDLAREKGLLIGCAPETFLGGGLKTCRKYLDDGLIGKPVAGTANFIWPGHEIWHPNPGFYYKRGAGPMLDMGPYYITALVSVLGPIEEISCFAARGRDVRRITSQPLNGTEVDVEVNTHYAGTARFACGTVVAVNMSFDVWHASASRVLELYGTEGTMELSDPDNFSGPVKVMRGESVLDALAGLEHGDAVAVCMDGFGKYAREMPRPYHDPHVKVRGLGVLDMAGAIVNGRPPRVSAELAFHVTEALLAFDKASESGRAYRMTSTCERPAPVPAGLVMDTLD